VAQHALTVYDRYRADAEWTAFFSDIERLRDRMLAASGLPIADLNTDYVYIRIGDLISLVFCAGWTDPQHFDRWTISRRGDRVCVAPDLFDGTVIPVQIEARVIRTQAFQSERELLAAWTRADPIVLSGHVLDGP
jgi:hypothetical protein